MKNPKLVIVGRPNVGKSALFNRICEKRISIVDEEEGLTRDCLYAFSDFEGKPFEIVDTGGIDPVSNRPFNEEVLHQTKIAMKNADTIVMVVDSRVGVTNLDKQVAKLVFKIKKPLTLAINKVDTPNIDKQYEFFSLGIKRMVNVSALHGYNIAELLEAAFEDLKFEHYAQENVAFKIAIIGRTNVGKSTLLNCLLDEKRAIVSPIRGTTRDSIDAHVTIKGESYTFIDTAGIRRKSKQSFAFEKFASLRTARAIQRADLSLLLVDVSEGVTMQDKKIARAVEKEGRGCILVVNKWDMVEGCKREVALQEINSKMPNFPVVFISAQKGYNIDKLVLAIDRLKDRLELKVSTAELNKFIGKCLQRCQPPRILGKRLRIYYVTQTKNNPFCFRMFVNYPFLMTRTYRKYITNQFRKMYCFYGAAIVFEIRRHN